ncbi:MAG: hypothetical protein WKG07_38345 [Hymenobacter sp.]
MQPSSDADYVAAGGRPPAASPNLFSMERVFDVARKTARLTRAPSPAANADFGPRLPRQPDRRWPKPARRAWTNPHF